MVVIMIHAVVLQPSVACINPITIKGNHFVDDSTNEIFTIRGIDCM